MARPADRRRRRPRRRDPPRTDDDQPEVIRYFAENGWSIVLEYCNAAAGRNGPNRPTRVAAATVAGDDTAEHTTHRGTAEAAHQGADSGAEAPTRETTITSVAAQRIPRGRSSCIRPGPGNRGGIARPRARPAVGAAPIAKARRVMLDGVNEVWSADKVAPAGLAG